MIIECIRGEVILGAHLKDSITLVYWTVSQWEFSTGFWLIEEK